MKAPTIPQKSPQIDDRDDLDLFGLLAPESKEERTVDSELRLDPLPRQRGQSEPENYWI